MSSCVVLIFILDFVIVMSSRYPGFGSRNDDNESKEDFVTIGTHFDPAEPTNSTSILATLGEYKKRVCN